MAYGVDLRRCALEMMKKKKSYSEVAKLLNIGTSSLRRWKKRAEKGRLEAKYPSFRGGYKVDDKKLASYIKENADAYLHEIAKKLGVRTSSVCEALKRLKITRKKRHRNTVSEMKTNVQPIVRR